MTAAGLSGRDLDVAVARALGHNTERKFVKAWNGIIKPGDVCHVYDHWQEPHIDAYSTDPATLDEMLEHLMAVGVRFNAYGRPGGRWFVEGYLSCRDGEIRRRPRVTDRGRTLQEATARLVVAVKEAMP